MAARRKPMNLLKVNLHMDTTDIQEVYRFYDRFTVHPYPYPNRPVKRDWEEGGFENYLKAQEAAEKKKNIAMLLERITLSDFESDSSSVKELDETSDLEGEDFGTTILTPPPSPKQKASIMPQFERKEKMVSMVSPKDEEKMVCPVSPKDEEKMVCPVSPQGVLKNHVNNYESLLRRRLPTKKNNLIITRHESLPPQTTFRRATNALLGFFRGRPTQRLENANSNQRTMMNLLRSKSKSSIDISCFKLCFI